EWFSPTTQCRRRKRARRRTRNCLCCDRCRRRLFQFSLSILANCHFTALFASPIVTTLLQFERQLFPAAANDAPGHHNMDMVGHDIVQKPLIMSDQKNSDIRSSERVNAMRDDLERIDVEPAVGFIENRVSRLDHGELENLAAL